MANYDQRNPLDYRFGQLAGGVTSLDTTLTSTAFQTLPSDLSVTKYLPMTLADDSLGVYETIWVTGHSAASSAVTAVRGREGSTARAWATGATWRCAPTVRDAVAAYTRATLPTDAHIGQRAMVTDESWAAEKYSEGWGGTSTGYARYKASAAQSVAAASAVICAFATAAVTTSLVTRNVSGAGHSFTLNRAGLWALSANIRWASGAVAGERYASIEEATVGLLAAQGATVPNPAAATTLTPAATVWLPAGAVVDVGLYQGTGGAYSTEAGSWTFFHLAWIRG